MTFVKDAQTLEMLKDHIKRKTKWREELTSNFVNVYAKAEEKSHKLEASKIMQNLSGFNIISPKSKHEKENIKPFPFSQNVTYNPESQLFTKINPTDLTKGIPKLHRPHGSISFTKLEKSLTSLERELSAEKQRVPKALRYLSLKKMGKKIDDTYQKQIRRINRRLQADRDKVKDEDNNVKEEGMKDQVDFINEKPKEKPQINENIGKMKLSQTLSMILKTKVSPKSMKGISLNNIDCSENDTMFFRGTSMNAIENFHKNPSSITSIMDLDKQLPPPIKQTPLKSSEKKVPQSLNDLEINCTSGEKGCAPFDKASSTVRIHNRLKKILQFEPKQQAQQDHPRFLSIKSQLLDSKSYVMLNSLELNVSPKRSLLQSFNVKTRKGSFFQKKD